MACLIITKSILKIPKENAGAFTSNPLIYIHVVPADIIAEGVLSQQRAVQTTVVFLCLRADKLKAVTMRQQLNLPVEYYKHLPNVCTAGQSQQL